MSVLVQSVQSVQSVQQNIKEVSINGIPLFTYNYQDDSLCCPYCKRFYYFNNAKIRTKFIQNLSSGEPHQMFFRCIMCTLNVNTNGIAYPFLENIEFNPNDEQKLIISELYQQLLITSEESHNNYLFLLEGQAGTGKTSTITSLFRYPEFSNMGICFSAPTNKALSVMMQKLTSKTEENEELHELNTDTNSASGVSEVNGAGGVGGESGKKKYIFKTVYKLTGSKTSINTSGETKFNRQSSTEISFHEDIIIIDEASMIDKLQVVCILDSIENLKKKIHTQANPPVMPIIIFMGDVAQLPPVCESISLIFDPVTHSKYNIKKLMLTQIMRSKDRLTDLSHNIRKLVPLPNEESVQEPPILSLKKFECGAITYHSDRSKWLNKYADLFKQNLGKIDKNGGAPVIIVYTNAECDSLNTECRDIIFNHPKQQYVEGELLVFKGFYNIKRSKFNSVTQTGSKSAYYIKFFTSEPVIAERISRETYTIPCFNYSKILPNLTEHAISDWLGGKIDKSREKYVLDGIVSNVKQWVANKSNGTITTHNSSIDTHLNKIISSISRLLHQYNVNKIGFNDTSKIDALDTNPTEVYITSITDQDMIEYEANCAKIRDIIKSGYISLMLMFKGNQPTKLLMDLLFQLMWKEYYRTYIWPFADIAYGYAMTSHKVQGSTIQHTFINVSNIMGCRLVDPVVKSKSLYTTMTRASLSTDILHHIPTLLSMVPDDAIFNCSLCKKRQLSNQFTPVNYTMDRKCIDQILSAIEPMCIYDLGEDIAISDKSKNLYKIKKLLLTDVHINDAYEYIINNNLLKHEIERYRQSNVQLVREVISRKK